MTAAIAQPVDPARPAPGYGLDVHPAADAMPLMSPEELEQLAEDIKTQGLLHPITLDRASGLVVDGRNRLLALRLLGQRLPLEKVEKVDFADDAAICAYVASANVTRRQLTKSQLAMCAARLIRQGLNLAGGGVKNRDAVGARFGISGRIIQDAQVVIDHGDAQLLALVEAGDLATHAAAALARNMSARVQREILSENPEAPWQAAQEAAVKVRALGNVQDGQAVSFRRGRATAKVWVRQVREDGMVDLVDAQGRHLSRRLDRLAPAEGPPAAPEARATHTQQTQPAPVEAPQESKATAHEARKGRGAKERPIGPAPGRAIHHHVAHVIADLQDSAHPRAHEARMLLDAIYY